MTDRSVIRTAWLNAGQLRPYRADPETLSAITPPGGEWSVVVAHGAITRSVVWNRTEVALVNARGDLDDTTEGQIAMALRAAPVVDMALRVILSLSRDKGNLDLIARVAETAIAHIEAPAPRVPEPDEDDEDADPALEPRGPPTRVCDAIDLEPF